MNSIFAEAKGGSQGRAAGGRVCQEHSWGRDRDSLGSGGRVGVGGLGALPHKCAADSPATEVKQEAGRAGPPPHRPPGHAGTADLAAGGRL